MPSQTFSTPSLCALFRGFMGCAKTSSSLMATAGEYTLNVEADALTDLALTLNGEELPTPPLTGGKIAFSIPVTLKASNQLEVTPVGFVGSFATLEIVGNELPSGMNAAPVVADLALTAATSRRAASGVLSVIDADAGQNHTSDILNDARNGVVSLMGTVFSYTGHSGFKGQDSVSILTVDSGNPARGTVSSAVVNVTYNTAPILAASQSHRIPKGDESYTFRLDAATDTEGDELTYSLGSQPSQGTLDCGNQENAFECTFTPPENFDNSNISFSYKANDGELDSNTSNVTLRPVIAEEGIPIIQLAAGGNQSCVLFSDGGVRCWGRINFPDYSGDTAGFPLFYDRFDIGENFVKIALTADTYCGLTDSGNIRCWGNPRYIGFRDTTLQTTLTPSPGIDFGTSLKVVDIVSNSSSFCALFEDGRVRCWGANRDGQLGVNVPFVGGAGVKPSDTDFVKLSGRVAFLGGGSASTRFCVILEGGGVQCWGMPLFGNEPSESRDIYEPYPIPLGESTVQVEMGTYYSCALLASGKVKCWGRNFFGELGTARHRVSVGENELLVDAETVDFLGLRAKKIAVGERHACALLENATVYCWGHSEYFQLGWYFNPRGIGGRLPVTFLPPISFDEGIVDIVAADVHNCTLLAKGSVRCWGGTALGFVPRPLEDVQLDRFDFRDANIEKDFFIYPRVSFSSRSLAINEQLVVSAEESVFRGKAGSYLWDFGDGTTATGSRVSPSI